MKKIFIAAAICAAFVSTANAGSVTVDYQKQDVVDSANDQYQIGLTVRENINKNFVADVQVQTSIAENTNKVGGRVEAGVTGKTSFGRFSPYARVAVGQKFTDKGDFSTYSVEPGVAVALTDTLTASVGYRYRTAFNVTPTHNDTTETARASLSYKINDLTSVKVGYDQVRGDSKQDNVTVGITRSF
jgi:opacity protein-like surface antigen